VALMAAKLEKTRAPGIYKRGGKYAVQYRGIDGKRHQESAPTYDAARALKARRGSEVRDGVDLPSAKITFGAYVLDWIGRYQGRGRRGFREQTRRAAAAAAGRDRTADQ
jgi:hypothetical protein